MKSIVLTYTLILFSISIFSQDLKPHKIDDSVQVSLPADFIQSDTLGQLTITGKTTFGFIQITKQADNPHTTPDIDKIKHLKRYYDDYVKRIGSSAKGGVISNVRDTLLENLRVKDFTLAVDSGSGKQFRNIRILHENGATYTFQYLYKDIHAEYATPESIAFFESIKIPPSIDVKSQFTSPENTTGKAPKGNTAIYIGIAAVILLIIVILIFVRRKKAKQKL